MFLFLYLGCVYTSKYELSFLSGRGTINLLYKYIVGATYRYVDSSKRTSTRHVWVYIVLDQRRISKAPTTNKQHDKTIKAKARPKTSLLLLLLAV